jgi:SAM-dependent methyltransferase
MTIVYGDDHRKNIDVIGGTNACPPGTPWNVVQWNRYYFSLYKTIVHAMLFDVTERGAVLDLGTSHGNWYHFLKAEGFTKIYGVEISVSRAALAQACGYTKVFNCDAADTPLPDGSLDVVISNDVLVHILKADDKVAVIKKAADLLKPGGAMIINHPTCDAYGLERKYTVLQHCAFAPMTEMIAMVTDNTTLQLEWVSPSYFHWRHRRAPFFINGLRRLISVPLVPWLLRMIDRHWTANHRPQEEADTIYYRFRKPVKELKPA